MEIASTNGSCWVVELLICGQYATVDVLIDKVGFGIIIMRTMHLFVRRNIF